MEGAACAKYDMAKALPGGGKVEGSKSEQAIVVNTVLKNGGSVDKATSGINGARTQREKDSSDALKGGAKKPELAKLRKLSRFLSM